MEVIQCIIEINKMLNTTTHNNEQLQKLSYLDTEPQAMKKTLNFWFIN